MMSVDRAQRPTPLTPAHGSYRRVWFATLDDGLTCSPDARGHRIKDLTVWNDGAIRCEYVPPLGGGQCGRLIYVVGGGLRTIQGAPMFALTHVAHEELRHMARMRMSIPDALAYLGIRFPH